MMAEGGVPLPVVQAMVGHMSTRMVRYCTHISNRAARTAVEKPPLDNASPGLTLWGILWGNQKLRKTRTLSH